MTSRSTHIRVTNPISNTEKRQLSHSGPSVNVRQLLDLIERQWELLPKQAKALLLESTAPVDLRTLANFWSSPVWREHTRECVSAGLSGTSWSLAHIYLKLGKMREARALALNGSFLHQCTHIPIESIAKLCEEKDNDASVEDFNLPLFSEAVHSLRTPQTMSAFLLDKLRPYEYEHMMRSRANTQSRNVMSYVEQIGDDWSGDSLPRTARKPISKTTATETHIQLILVRHANENARHTVSIGSSTTLKTLFKDYARERGDSLRSLRFSYRGNALFLSSTGSKTPNQLNMKDQDVITVFDASAPRETGSGGNNPHHKSTLLPKKGKTSQNETKNGKARGKKKKDGPREEPAQAPNWQARHSKKLSKLHEEVHPRLQAIRRRLNALDIERQLPKKKRKNPRNKKVRHTVAHPTLPHSGMGGKAGKSFFSVQVGAVQHLYKTTPKPSRQSRGTHAAAVLDLHGCTREEALRKLDACLPAWVETAMRGSYPFVMPATIVCGGGNQILAGAVETWIHEQAHVAKARKALIR